MTNDLTFTGSVHTLHLPKYVGYWVIGGNMGLHVSQTRKPRWLTRKMAKWFLEWEWRDA